MNDVKCKIKAFFDTLDDSSADFFEFGYVYLRIGYKKRASELQRAATTSLPLLRSRPGGLGGSWPCRTYPAAKVLLFPELASLLRENILPQPIKG